MFTKRLSLLLIEKLLCTLVLIKRKKSFDPCEYNPDEKRPAWDYEVHDEAEVIVGHNGKWRLCLKCAALPEFKRFRKRKLIS